ncbi:hypothetical protein BJY04DRAFT_216696 [Aspergillus karnatakaensis]|uniref:uncharacterized protein n=1 Tax=Aspergillus karnatakaensis TaxID=1810916 RepID=UPI003CCE15A6
MTLEDIAETSEQISYMQPSSPFFNKLPLEIRHMVYCQVLAFPVPLSLVPARWEDVIWSERVDWEYIGSIARLPNRWTLDRLHRQSLNWTIWGLLASCRRIYSESIRILYEQNTILITDLRTTSSIPTAIVPHRLVTIRLLEVHLLWDITRMSDWDYACSVFATMTGLRSFIVNYKGIDSPINPVPYLEGMECINIPHVEIFIAAGKSYSAVQDGRWVFAEGPWRLLKGPRTEFDSPNTQVVISSSRSQQKTTSDSRLRQRVWISQ